MIIRLEQPNDYLATERLTLAAFKAFTFPDGSKPPYPDEHYLVHTMRDAAAFVPELAFVGEQDGEIIANIMYTKSRVVRPDGSELATLTFGPVSVKPELQGCGFGAEIIRQSLHRARELNHGAVIIVGHPSYYPRFGFKSAGAFGLTLPPETEVFDGAFMALELAGGYLGTAGGMWHEDEVYAIDQAAFAKWNNSQLSLAIK